jgi:hypothetical protein
MSKFVDSIIKLINALGTLPNTFWGILVLFASMKIAVKYNSDIGFYFAGVGSTLLGIKHDTSDSSTLTLPNLPPEKVQNNASN